MAIVEYLKGIKSEAKHIHWPSTTNAWQLTALVIAISLLVAGYLGLLDYLFTRFIEGYII